MTTKPNSQLTLKDRLSRLTFQQACKLLGEHGKALIRQGGRFEINLDEQVYFEPQSDLFRVRYHDGAVVTITVMAEARNRLHWNCTECELPCYHAGATFSLVLEEKTALGLAVAPPERIPIESLGEEALVELALSERAERAKKEKFRLSSQDTTRPWTDYTITSANSGKSYRLALRGEERGISYCSCPDFRTNTLGTCKHVLYALDRIKSKFPASKRQRSFRSKEFTVHLAYGEQLELRLGLPGKLDEKAQRIVGPIAQRPIVDVHDLIKRINRLEKLEHSTTIYPDAEEYIQQRLFQDHIESTVAEIRKSPARHPLRDSLLKTKLLPYQLDGIAFAAGAGRAILADDMGLGKTIQGIGVAELLVREAGIRRVLVICPTSLKSQWSNEIQKFSDRSCQLVLGSAEERSEQYDNHSLFTICNYEQVLRDVMSIERVKWDLIILDEGQRIKNWEAKTSNVVKSLQSRFALVLTGTPLENRLDDLFSIMQFVDDRRLAPAFRFFNRHRMVDEKGKVLGYKNLAQLRENLSSTLLRRTREEVLDQLPPRTTEIVRIPPTEEQHEIHNTNMRIVASVVHKPYISEMDLLRLRQALMTCRMAADSTYLVNKETPAFSSKLERLEELLIQLFERPDRKIILFSEWTTMLTLIEEILNRQELKYVRLDGSVPQKKRQQLVHEFQNNSDCQLFITTNAGSTGLNLQAANTVINVDLPWNPAVLEQRIGRAHRMGQKQPVEVFVLVTEETLEENLLGTLASKKDLALAALDMNSDVDQVEMVSGTEELKSRLEILLGAKATAPIDETLKKETEQQQKEFAHRERVAAASGELLGAAFSLLGELVSQELEPVQPSQQIVSQLHNRLAECVHEDESGRQQLTVTLPNRNALDNLSKTLARLLVVGEKT